ncbi:MAG: 3-deoxy-D-manno-octulosonic acid transferase [Planctomycetia bacterium]|nr:3-deoxy-D-manno-octulosonic acid transferase [Planctomycetia bacterium]
MAYLLNLLYLALLVAASPWLVYASVRKKKYRQGFAEKLLGLVPKRAGSEPCVWVHAVSVGEVMLVASLVKQLRAERPTWRVVLSTTTQTGLETARKKYPDLLSFYCPLDFSWAVRAAMRRLRPSMLVLAELELWPNLIAAAKQANVPVAVVNGRLGERSFRGYRKVRFLMRRLLSRLDVVAVQNEEYRSRFLELGCEPARLSVTGSLKFDGAASDRRNPHTLRLAELAGIRSDEVVFLAGSTQEGEEAAALEAYRAAVVDFPKLKLILVPRHPDRFEEVAELGRRSGFVFRRRSELAHPGNNEAWQVLLVDAIGELGAWWGLARIAFVGGSFGDRGGQNMLEPAGYGAAVSFGPNTWNFRDIAAALVEGGAAEVVPDPAGLTAFVRRCLSEPGFASELGERARELVAANRGATNRTARLLLPLVAEAAAARRAA